MSVKWIGDVAQDLDMDVYDAIELLSQNQSYPMNGLLDEDRVLLLRRYRDNRNSVEGSGPRTAPIVPPAQPSQPSQAPPPPPHGGSGSHPAVTNLGSMVTSPLPSVASLAPAPPPPLPVPPPLPSDAEPTAPRRAVGEITSVTAPITDKPAPPPPPLPDRRDRSEDRTMIMPTIED